MLRVYSFNSYKIFYLFFEISHSIKSLSVIFDVKDEESYFIIY